MKTLHWQLITTLFLVVIFGIAAFHYARKTWQLLDSPIQTKVESVQSSLKEQARAFSTDPNHWEMIWPALDWRNRKQSPKYYRDSKSQNVFYVDNKRVAKEYQVAIGYNGKVSEPYRPTFLEFIRIEILPNARRREIVVDAKESEWQQAIGAGHLVEVKRLPR